MLALILLGACREPPYLTRVVESPSPPVSATSLPDVQCRGEIPEPLKKELEDYRLAQEEDFVASIREYAPETKEQLTCSIFTADFNADNMKDYAVLAVDTKTSDFRFELLLNRGNGDFGTAVVRTYKRSTESEQGIVYTTMTFKPPGESGPAQRDNFPLKPGTPERESFLAKPAIELWRALPTTPDRLPQDLNISTLAYCSEIFYFVNGKLQTTSVCD